MDIFYQISVGAHSASFLRSKDDTSDSVEGPRFSVHDNGTLEIYSAQKEDSGPYTCFAKNTEGSSAINVMLSVKGRVFPADCDCSQELECF